MSLYLNATAPRAVRPQQQSTMTSSDASNCSMVTIVAGRWLAAERIDATGAHAHIGQPLTNATTSRRSPDQVHAVFRPAVRPY